MKTIIITGGTSGIGQALVEHFANHDYEVIFTGRNKEKAAAMTNALLPRKVRFFETDFASFDSIEQTAARIRAAHECIDILVNNAGVWEMTFSETKDGIETNFAVNHLAPMLFTLKLLPVINKQGGRIINTSSGAHRRNILDLEDIEWRQKEYNGIATYSQSKLCNIYFTHQLAEELAHTGILVNTVHPGYVKTNLFNNMGSRAWEGVPDAGEGARSAIFAATDTRLVSGSKLYIYHEQLDPNITTMARNADLARKVWDRSMQYLGARVQPATG